MSLDAMKQALAALENPWAAGAEGVADAIIALRAAIEQAQEPVAWADMDVHGEDKGLSWTPGHFHKTPLYTAPPHRKPLTPREVELLDGMIEVQLRHAAQCDGIANRTMAEKQKSWDMERVELLRKLKSAHGIKGGRMTDRELMQQALHTLEGWANHGKWVWPESALEQAKRNTTESIAALSERLSQPEPEPLWIQPNHLQKARQAPFLCRVEPAKRDDFVPLYTASPQRQWKGLTDDEIKAPIQRAMQHFGFDSTKYNLGGAATVGFLGLVKEIEAKLKAKNNG